MVYRQKVPQEEKPTLELSVEPDIEGSLILRAAIPPELEPKVMVAMRNATEKKCFRDGMLEILLPCLRKHNQAEKQIKLNGFCRWLSLRSGITVTATLAV